MIKLCELPQVPEVELAIAEVIKSGQFVKGPKAEEFATKWAERCEMAYGISVGSGAQALELAIEAEYNKDSQHHVLYSQNTFKAVPNAIKRSGLIPIPTEQDMCPAVFAHHLHDERFKFIPDIEDCSHCHGYKPSAQTAIFSLFPTKILGACGEAGIILTNSEEVRDYCLEARSHGQNGTNARMDEIQAAILLAKLPYLDGWIARRKEIVDMYDEAFGIKTLGDFHYSYCIEGNQTTVDDLISMGVESKLMYQEPYVALPLYPEMTNEQVGEVIGIVKSL